MRYICSACGKNYSGDNVPVDKRCKKCNAKLELFGQSASPKTETNNDKSELNKQSGRITGSEYKFGKTEANKIEKIEPVAEKNEHRIEQLTPVKEKQKYVSLYKEEPVRADNVTIKTDASVVKTNNAVVKTDASGIPKANDEKVNRTIEVADDIRVKSDTLETYEVQRIVGVVNESDTMVDGQRRFFTTKLRDSIKYGQNMSNTYNRVIVNTNDGKRVYVVFYGDSALGQSTLRKGAKIDVTGRYNTNNEFMAKAISVDGIWLKITNEPRRERTAQPRNTGRSVIMFIIFALALLAFLSIIKKISYMGVENFFVQYLMIGVLAGWGCSMLLNVIFPLHRERNRRWGFVIGIIVAIIAMIA